MQCCSLRHWTFSPSPVTYTTGCCFWYGSIPSFFLKKKCRKAKRLPEGALQIAVRRRKVKSKGEKEKYKQLNTEFQILARKDKKVILSNQCKEIEENIRVLCSQEDSSDVPFSGSSVGRIQETFAKLLLPVLHYRKHSTPKETKSKHEA